MKKHHSELWQQIGTVLLPLLGFLLIHFLTSPEFASKPSRRPTTHRREEVRQVTVSIPSPEVPGALREVTPEKLVQVLDLMEQLPAPSTTPDAVNVTVQVAAPAPPITLPGLKSRTFASGLSAPDGLAIDPRTRNIYVSEESADRIVLFSPKGRKKTVVDENTRLYDVIEKQRVRVMPIRAPEGLAMDADGTLFVCEDRPGGRLLALRVSESGAVEGARDITPPGNWSRYAWESVAVRDSGEMLLAGSSAESEVGLAGGIFQGAILYRDSEGNWWAPVLRTAASFSAVAFSKSGQFAVYADELSGTIGWVDLQSRYLREGASQMTCRSPEGIVTLPDGRLAITEESGRVIVLDPQRDSSLVVAEGLGQIESVLWDDEGGHLLVTADGNGTVLEFRPDAPWPAEGDSMKFAPCQAEGAVRHIPARTPAFLKPLLNLSGQDSAETVDKAFSDLTERTPMFAADARAVLIHGTEDVADPIERVQFVAFDPNRMRFDEPGGELSLSALILRTRSGQILRTKMSRTVIITGNIWLGRFENHGVFDLPLPFAFQAMAGPRGHAVIHFTGLGRSPDVAIAIHPTNPEQSYMLVTHVDGTLEQYHLKMGDPGSADNWVVSLPPRHAQPWINITPTPEPPAATPPKS